MRVALRVIISAVSPVKNAISVMTIQAKSVYFALLRGYGPLGLGGRVVMQRIANPSHAGSIPDPSLQYFR